MSSPLNANRINEIQQLDAQQRYQYTLKEICQQAQIWLLIDEHGAVMLNSDDEDCVPIWPNKEFAELWATDEWAHCKSEAISLQKWQARWTDGLVEDELALVVFPNQDNQGVILYPDDFEYELQQQLKKKRANK